MHEALVVIAATGCALTAALFAKTTDTDWFRVLMSLLFAGIAGALLASCSGPISP